MTATKSAAAAENDQDATVVGVQEVQIATEIRNVDHPKKIALRETSTGIVEATVEKANEIGIKEDHRLAILFQAEKWVAL
jgi:hypothetical protein